MKSFIDRINKKPIWILGLMSGTSLDGLDLALVEWFGDDPSDFDVTNTATIDYDTETRNAIAQCITGTTSDVCSVNFQLGRIWGKQVNQYLNDTELNAEDITCIGSHGQTVWHESGESTLQIGEPAVLSALTGIPVISNFREQDIAWGGTGAPLIPFLDWTLYHSLPGNTVALNIGGIANITCLGHDADSDEVVGWDTGPGNMVMNTLMAIFTDNRLTYDHDGQFARQGRVDDELLELLMEDLYINRTPPKSTGREYYSQDFVRKMFPVSEELTKQRKADIVATACEWTARSIAGNITRFWKPQTEIDRVVVSGGGANNKCLVERLASHLSNPDILPCSEFGIPVDSKEAIGFALLAYAFIKEVPGNFPRVTGARKPVVLGKLTM